MKKLRLLLTLIAVSICSVQGAWADRMAPELPTAQTLESGQSYYLYNVAEQKFLCRSTTSTSYAAIGTYGDKIIITATDNEDEYTIQWASNNYYFYAQDSYVSSSSYKNSETSMFTISESSQGYTIQRSSSNTSYYKSDEFLGYDGSNGDRLTPALAEGSIQWMLYSVDDAEYYMAKHKLYTYLEVADQYNFYVTQYDLVYNNSASTTADLDEAQLSLKEALDMSQNLVSPSWTEYPVLFQNSSENKWKLSEYYNNQKLHWDTGNVYANEATSTLVGTVNVDADATLCYTFQGNQYATMRVYLDGELKQIIMPNQSNNNARRYYVELTAGKHDVTWTCLFNKASTNNSSYSHYLSEIGVVNTPTIVPATTTVEGQLGTEVLKLVDPVSSVKKIVVNGVIGADDWTTLGLMVNAFSIDLSGATATAPIPARLFTGSKFPFLHNFVLPQGLTEIGEEAFYQSDIENEITFPASLTTIGSSAFRESKIKAAHMPEGLTTVDSYAFEKCYYLENATWPSTATTIPVCCFLSNYNLRTFTLPEGIIEIGNSAFYECSQFNARIPSTVEHVTYYAFEKTATDSLFIKDNQIVDYYAFALCDNLVYAEWPTTFVYAYSNGYTSTSPVVANCPKLNKVKLMSPTVVTYNYSDFLAYNTLSDITLQVPDFLVSAYKLDPYWYQCNVEGFNSADIEEWNVTKTLTLNAGQRIGGIPSLKVTSNGSLTINGSDAQTINNLDINYSPMSYYYTKNGYSYSIAQQWGMMLGNSDNTTITGRLTEQLRTAEKTWYFLCLPFDTKVGDITATADATGAATSYAIRYYDGANRATVGTGSNWKNFSAEDIIPAGTGFIYQTAKAARSIFVAQDNATKQYILSNNEFVKALADNPSDVTANKGWNLVGNPWQTYYNIHKLNFTAPITVWDMSNKKYVAYSIIDDDYAIKPLEAIFVQCPDEVNSISFPIDGRQLTADIESQNGAPAFGGVKEPARKLIDIELTNGEQSDKTRFVLNPEATMDYELTCDASKFFSLDNSIPQIYTIENNDQLAINERPAGDGTVQLGIKVATDGTYTISAPRNMFESIVLIDKETGTETDLTQNSYTFSATAGSYDTRFVLSMSGIVITGIDSVKKSDSSANIYYNLNGQRVSQPAKKGLYIVNGKKVLK